MYSRSAEKPYQHELNLSINFLEKEEVMELEVLSTIIFLCAIDVVTSLKIPYATGMLLGCSKE